MNYIGLMNHFWQIASTTPIPASEVALYAFLVNECNSHFWDMPFPCPSSYICERLRFSRQTLITARKHLEQLGLIRYEKGKSRFHPSKFLLLDLTLDLTLNNKNKNKENIKLKIKDSRNGNETANAKNQRRAVEVVPASAEDYEAAF